MPKIKCKQFYLVGIFFVSFQPFVHMGNNDSKDGISFDLNWWRQAVASEQEGFILGYLDYRRPKVVVTSISNYRTYVDNTMEPENGIGPKYVTEAIAKHWLTVKPSIPKKGGESDPLNGLNWANDAWNTGYVVGYMQCYSIVTSKSIVDLYKSDIDQNYASTNRVNDSLAAVLTALLQKHKVSRKINY